jgi:hypothetical protein
MSLPKNAESSCFQCYCGKKLSLLRNDFYISAKGVKYALCAENYPFCPTSREIKETYLSQLNKSYIRQFAPPKSVSAKRLRRKLIKKPN